MSVAVFCEECQDVGRCAHCDRGQAMPKRVQLSRAKGWRLPPNTVKVDRSTKYWGNPYHVGEEFKSPPITVRDRAHAVQLYRAMHELDPGRRIPEWRKLVGKDLACWCPPDEPCHADVMLELVAKWAAEEGIG